MIRLIKSFGFAINGIKLCSAKESNFKIHLLSLLLVIIAGTYLKIAATEWMLISICAGFVLAMEMLNTAMEQLCDIVYSQKHPGIKMVKDIAAGAVLVSALSAIVCGVIIFLPKIIFLFQNI